MDKKTDGQTNRDYNFIDKDIYIYAEQNTLYQVLIFDSLKFQILFKFKLKISSIELNSAFLLKRKMGGIFFFKSLFCKMVGVYIHTMKNTRPPLKNKGINLVCILID